MEKRTIEISRDEVINLVLMAKNFKVDNLEIKEVKLSHKGLKCEFVERVLLGVMENIVITNNRVLSDDEVSESYNNV
jgi:hypothetical protein